MILSISSQLYGEVLNRLTDEIGARGYFSGVLEFNFDELFCRLVVSCFVYRRAITMPEGPTEAITDLVPVWWEFHTFDAVHHGLSDHFHIIYMTAYT